MTAPAPSFVSPCCGAPCRQNVENHPGEGVTRWMECAACGQPCDPMEKSVRDRIEQRAVENYKRRERPVWIHGFVRQPLGVLRAAFIVAECAVENDGAVDGATLQAYAAIRREAERLTGTHAMQEATDGRKPT